MAPPGFGPPGYTIPQRYMNRTPPPEGTDTNTRPYLIFFSYLLTCLSISIFLVQRILKKYSILKKSATTDTLPSKHIFLFSVLAAVSLFTTWTFLFKYFGVSYRTWLMWRSYYELDPKHRHWGLWLKETSLFREAWELVVVGNARYWWSHQIFSFALGLGLHMEQKGVKRGIKHTWAFMLLGQIVAISFATNLYLLTILLSPQTPRTILSSRTQQSNWFGLWLLNLGALLATVIPAFLLANEHYWHHSVDFMPVLLAPHISLLVLPFTRALVPDKYLLEVDPAFNDKTYGFMWFLTFVNAGLMFVKTTLAALSYGGFHGIWSALLEHPAASSVSFDVVFCWITWICWYSTEGGRIGSGIHKTVAAAEDRYGGEEPSFAIKGGSFGGRVRRR
ncbi:hypothetical protein GQ44DRAFT_746728 [Phaeosphaeriaceae sp. PMI808]|nr:hypothetical protein GQ44DRAFT_746728 [Phaeosphaeriaceae sp. PMI808]